MKRAKSTSGQASATTVAAISTQSSRRHGGAAVATGRGHQQEDQHDRDEQEADPVDLRLDDEEDPVEGIRGESRREQGGKAALRPGEGPERGGPWLVL